MLALELRGLSKNFAAIRVANNISFNLPVGARHGLIGPNGAGKTTLVHLISGLLRPSAGSISLLGADITHLPPERRVALGLARTFQITSLFPALTVAENVGIALGARHGIDQQAWGSILRRPDILDEAAALLDQLGILALASNSVSELPYGQRRLVEIAVVLALKPKVLLLDEPAAGLSSFDRVVLVELLLRLPASLAVLIIEHDMSLIFRVAQRITVMLEGEILTEGSVAETRADPRVRDVYLGTRRHA
ncbi:ABC transporter ATP-binding protein [Pseudorhodoplanes sp.]|uniref:ABC transporter ATP-binding protein n=1 Tax=Pseudorhodoplanes sp. TaxID=1934341 RepID=UPI003D0ECF3B